MDSDTQILLDWANLPAHATTLSLWDTLHDGDLLDIESNLLARSLTMRFDVGYVRDFHKLPEKTQFVLKLAGVQSVRCLRSVAWPGELSVPLGSSREEEQQLIWEYQKKWREESFEWTDFERLTAQGLEVSTATLARADGAVALQLGVLVGNDDYVEAYVRAEQIEFSVGSETCTLEDFISLGERYWEAFAQGKLRRGDH